MNSIFDRIRSRYVEEYSRHATLTVFLSVLIVSLVIFIVAAILTNGESIKSILWWNTSENRDDTFMDYFNSIMYSSDRSYTYWNIIYPPLVTGFYWIIGYFTIPFVEVNGKELSSALRESQMGIMSYFLITFLTLYALYLVFLKFTKDRNIRTELLFLLILLSFPVIFAIERGNSILITVIFCCLFLIGYRSENKAMRWISYIALGCAAGFKLYPSILILLILRDRKYKETLICAAIVSALVFLPFIFTDGTPLILLETIISYTQIPGTGDGFMNIDQLTFTLFQTILPVDSVKVISITAIIIFTTLSFFVILFDKEMEHWKIVTLLFCNLILGPGVGTQYLFVYMLPPLLLFITSERDMTRSNMFYAVCFGLIMALVPGLMWKLAVVSSIKTICVILISAALIEEGCVHIYRGSNNTSKCSN